LELPRILVITDSSQAKAPLAWVLSRVFAAGCQMASVREKDLSAEARKALVQELLPIARRFGATLLVHGDIEAAKLVDGLHLPAFGDVGAAREALGGKAVIGLSCHTLEEVDQAAAKGADYVTLGPFAPTKSKPGYEPTLGLADFAKSGRSGVKVFALGGVDETNLSRLFEAGIWGVAGMGGFMRDPDPGEVFRAWASGFGAPR